MTRCLNNSHQDEWNEVIIGNNKTKTAGTSAVVSKPKTTLPMQET